MIHAFGLTSNPRKAHPPAVDDVSFEARAGDVTVLLGGVGAGKTTALRLMLELQQGRGITYFRGRPLHRIAHPAREVGVLLGDVPGHPARSVRGHLRMLCAASGVPARRADEVLETVGLVSLREERLGTLSRGMDRRLGLACALLPDPHTLVLDEPTDGLSAREAQWVHGMLRAHAEQGGTVLFTSADPKEAARTADRVVTLDGGRLVADQDAREFSRTRLRPRVAVRSPHAARLAALLTKEARTGRRSVEVVHEGGNRLSVYGSSTADVGEAAFRHGILIHQLADEVGDMGPGAGAGPGIPVSGEAGAAAQDPAADGDQAARSDSSPAEPEATVSGFPAGESGAAGAGAGLGAVPPGETGVEAEKDPAVERDRAAMPGPSPVVPEPVVRGLPMLEPETAVCDLPKAESGVSGLGVAVSASHSPAPGSSSAESGVSTLGSSAPEQSAVLFGPSSAAPGGTAPGASARERGTMPFGFSVESREDAPADTSTPRRAVPGGSVGEERSVEEEPPSGQGERALGVEVPSFGEAADVSSYEEPPASSDEEPLSGDTAQALSGEVAPLGEASDSRTGAEPAGTTAPVATEGASPDDTVTKAGGPAPGGVEPDGVDGSDGVDVPLGHNASGGGNASDGGEGSIGEGTPGEDGTVRFPVEALAGAPGSRTAEAATTVSTRRDAISAGQAPRTGGTSVPFRGITALRTLLPGARNPGNGQPHSARTARPDGTLDALPPLPPPISVRPAPSPLRPLRYEIRRATGIGVGFLTCGVALVVSALTAVLLARLGHTPQARLFGAWPRELPLPPAALAAGLLGALAFGDEFRHPALAADRGTVPRRLGLLTAKLLVSGATATMLAFLTVGCDAEALYIVYGRELTQVPADWLSLTASWFGLVVGCAWAGVLAAGVFRSTTGGLAAVLAVPVVVVPLVHEVMRGPALHTTAGFPVRMREVHLLQWPFGGERYLLGLVRVLAQPVGSALALSLSALLCAYLFTSLRTRFR
ncbi:ATP-binding cassette domain-containing protein [Streptomyces sp. NPDC053069]|uniref:ATP-binding cassette domain-containing protein n=1 Tax=Streptomyces sp. NPDC053069 TaxID=3365695 RepID=UPI0037D40CE9